jgi:Leucine-rich repeat (LRR) protein
VSPLSGGICAHLGSLLDLRMDENDLACDASQLAPLCKLRNLRSLSLDKNRLTELPALLGTMLSLRKIQMHTNQLTALPPSICLLHALDTLDLHKNFIRSLPHDIGKVRVLTLTLTLTLRTSSAACRTTSAR